MLNSVILFCVVISMHSNRALIRGHQIKLYDDQTHASLADKNNELVKIK